MEKRIVSLTVNGEEYEAIVAPNRTLLEVLRENLQLTGTKEGCGEGACGTCSVLLEGKPVRSCLTLAVEVQGRGITTIEGLASVSLHPLQTAWIEIGVSECGYCQPGQLMSAAALLKRNPNPSDAQITNAMKGNLCRCGFRERQCIYP